MATKNYIADKETLDSVKTDTTSILEAEAATQEAVESVKEDMQQMVSGGNLESGLPPKQMVRFKAAASDSKCYIYITEPTDTIVEEQVLCHVKGCMVRMSTEGYPETVEDGELVIDNTDIGAYSTDGYVLDGLENGTTYYFTAFPYSDHKVYNIMDCAENRSACTPSTCEQVTVEVKANDGSEIGEVTITLTNITNAEHSQEYTLTVPGEHTFEVEVEEEYYVSVSDVTGYVAPDTSDTYTAEGGGNRTITMEYIYAPALADCSWEMVKEISEAGKASEIWEIGDEKVITIDEVDYTLVIEDFDHDTITDGGGATAGVTFGLKNSLADTAAMNSSNTNVGGWTSCAMRTYLSDTILPTLPEDLQAVIKPVDKLSSAGNQGTAIETTSDKLWLHSEIEVFGEVTYSVAGEGSQYPYYATTDQRIKTLGDDGSANNWWERSPNASYATTFCGVASSGTAISYNASNSRGVSFGFCV